MKNTIQPLMKDANGVVRFKGNAIVQHLLDTHPTCDMNHLARMGFTDDRQQFAQLIGYSLSGYGDLSYVDDRTYAIAAEPNHNWCAGCSPDSCSGCGADPVESEPFGYYENGRFSVITDGGLDKYRERKGYQGAIYTTPQPARVAELEAALKVARAALECYAERLDFILRKQLIVIQDCDDKYFTYNAQSGKRGPEMDSEAEAIDAAAMAQGEQG